MKFRGHVRACDFSVKNSSMEGVLPGLRDYQCENMAVASDLLLTTTKTIPPCNSIYNTYAKSHISRLFPLLTRMQFEPNCEWQWQRKKPVCGVQCVKSRHVSGWCRFSCTGAYSYHPIQVRLHTWNGSTRHTLSEYKRWSRERSLPMIWLHSDAFPEDLAAGFCVVSQWVTI
jgi:hypothetical protein